MSKPTRQVLKILGGSAIIVLAAAALNFVVDPLQIFRPARLFAAMYSQDSRMQNAGLIRSQHFDSVFMGTSLAIHFRQSDIDRVLGGRSLKLSMTGSSSREQIFVLDAALQQHPRRIIWEVDDWIFRDAPDIDADPYLPADLYRRNARGIARYLFNGAMARESAWIAARSIPWLRPAVVRLTNGVMFSFPIADPDDINVLKPNFDVGAAYNEQKARASFASITHPVRRAYLGEGYNYEAMVRNFEQQAVRMIEAHPEVRWDIYFPPYSILQFVAMRDASPPTLKIVYDFTAYVAGRLAALPNVNLYDFRAVSDVTHNLANYSDVIHHSPAVDQMVLSWIAEGRYRADRRAPTALLEQLKAEVEAYQIDLPSVAAADR